MIGIKFKDIKDKVRGETTPLEIISQNTFNTSAEIIDFFYTSDMNTFFAVDTELPKNKLQYFKQGSSKEKYITQDDLKNDMTSVIGLDYDRHELEDGKATNTNSNQGLIDLSKEFGAVLYAESKSSSELFKGRMFVFLNRPTSKKLFRKYLELWSYEKYHSEYVINHHVANALYYQNGGLDKGTHVSHEYIDEAAFRPAQKLNVYDLSTYKLYVDGKLVWTSGLEVPSLEIPTTNVSNKLQKWGKLDELMPPNNYNRKGYTGRIGVKDILSPAEKQACIDKALISARGILDVAKVDSCKMNNGEILHRSRDFVADGEYLLQGLLKRKDGEIKTAVEFCKMHKSSRANFSYEPNHRKEEGYLQIVNGKIFDYQGGNTTLITLKNIATFEAKTEKYHGNYLPEHYSEEHCRIDFKQAPTGSGKSFAMLNRPKTIFLVPKRALGRDLGSKDGFVYIASTEEKFDGAIKRINDIPTDKKTATIVMTYAKFAYIHSGVDLTEYNLVIDEATNIFKTQADKYTQYLDLLLDSVFSYKFPHVDIISADPFFYESFAYYIGEDYSKIGCFIYEPSIPKGIEFIGRNRVRKSEVATFKRDRTLVYCNSIARAEKWAELIDGELIRSNGAIGADAVDLNPTKNYVFTSVIREGYSFTSDIDHFVIDSVTQTTCGVNTAIQASSRARVKASNYYIIHSGSRNELTAFKARFCEINRYIDLADVFFGEGYDKYADEFKGLASHLEIYNQIKGALVHPYDTLSISVLVGSSNDYLEKLEQHDIDFFIKGIKSAGYPMSFELRKPTTKDPFVSFKVEAKKIETNDWELIEDMCRSVDKFKKRLESLSANPDFTHLTDDKKAHLMCDSNAIDKTKFTKGKKLYEPIMDKMGQKYNAKALVRIVAGLHNTAKKVDVKECLNYFRKIGVGVIVWDPRGAKYEGTETKRPPKCTFELEDVEEFFHEFSRSSTSTFESTELQNMTNKMSIEPPLPPPNFLR